MRPEVALVTGGTSGIGRAIVEALVTEGNSVAFTYRRDADGANQLERELGDRARSYHLDLADKERPASLVAEIEESFGPIVGLVNNAAERTEGLLGFTADEALRACLEINFEGAYRCCRAVVPLMVRRRAGSIVSISSLAAFRGVAGLTAYAASKAALEGMTRSLAREVGKRGVRANLVVPGFVQTPQTTDVPAERVDALRKAECLPAGVPPSAVADAVVFLLSARAASITGQSLIVDAGSSA